MKQRLYTILYVILIQSLLPGFISAATIGSDTAVNRFNVSQTLFGGDRVAGFAALNGGFSLFGLGTTAIWDSFFPVSGEIALNAGHLILNTDLLLNNISSIKTLGSITGQNHTIDLSTTNTVIVTQTDIDPDCTVNFLTSLAYLADVATIAWSYDSQFVAVGLDSIAGSDLFLYSFNGSALTQVAAIDLADNIYALAWHPSKYNLAMGRDQNGAQELIVYNIDPNAPTLSTILTAFEYNQDVNALAYHPSGNYLALGGLNAAQELMLFPVNTNGSLNTGAAISVNLTVGVSTEGLSWNSTGTYLAVGTLATGVDNELRIYQLQVSPLALTLNSSLDLAVVNTVAWHPIYQDLLAVGLSTSPRLRWYAFDPGVGSLTQIGSISTNLNGTAVRNIAWNPDGGCLALTQNVSTPGNEFIIYSFNETSSALTEFQSFPSATSCEALAWAPNGNYVAFGNDGNSLFVYQRGELSFLDQCFTFSNVTILLNNNLSLQRCCLNCVENCEINGKGFQLDIQPTATISVGSNSILTLKDITINGVAFNNIRCEDGSGNLILDNVTFNLTDNYNFSAGDFIVNNQFLIKGDNKTFSYLSDQISIISPYSSLVIDPTMTFLYAPSTNRRDRLLFQDSTAQLILNSATFSTTTTGIDFLKGSILVDGMSYLAPSSSLGAGAITFGDGVQSINSMKINILPAAQLIVNSGKVENKNV